MRIGVVAVGRAVVVVVGIGVVANAVAVTVDPLAGVQRGPVRVSVGPHVAVVVEVGVVADAVTVGVHGLGRVQWEGVVCVADSVSVVVHVLGEGGRAAADDRVGLTVAVGVHVRARVRREVVAVVAVSGPVRASWGVTVGVVPLRCVQRELVVGVVVAVVIGVGV